MTEFMKIYQIHRRSNEVGYCQDCSRGVEYLYVKRVDYIRFIELCLDCYHKISIEDEKKILKEAVRKLHHINIEKGDL